MLNLPVEAPHILATGLRVAIFCKLARSGPSDLRCPIC